jgi:hypothetical protein
VVSEIKPALAEPAHPPAVGVDLDVERLFALRFLGHHGVNDLLVRVGQALLYKVVQRIFVVIGVSV